MSPEVNPANLTGHLYTFPPEVTLITEASTLLQLLVLLTFQVSQSTLVL